MTVKIMNLYIARRTGSRVSGINSAALLILERKGIPVEYVDVRGELSELCSGRISVVAMLLDARDGYQGEVNQRAAKAMYPHGIRDRVALTLE